VAFFGEPVWSLAAASAFGGLAFLLGIDLDETAMLGDAGANPLGGVLGLGLGMSLEGVGLWAAVVVVIALNLASERWSFSKVIDRTPPLRALDRLGRRG
jgi:UDP-GlcNAc:undecaprenyl-phosphate/decaprenyl-phosphate GlcNAc-1-phosphate transferase